MPAKKSERRLASINVGAQECDVNPRTLRRWISDGRITGYRVGPRLLKVDLDEVASVIQPVGGGA